MMMKIKSSLFAILLPIAILAQSPVFHYKRKILNNKDTWHQLFIPDAMYAHTNKDLSDIRIYGFTKDNDTIEAAYILENPVQKTSLKHYEFKLLNQTHTAEGYYFTLKLPEKQLINHIKLSVSNTNFDWLVQVQGSQNQNKWFNLTDSYRILGIQNNKTKYRYTKIHFPDADYQYFRIFIKTTEKVEFIKAELAELKKNEVTPKKYTIQKQEIRNDKKTKQSSIDLQLANLAPINQLKITIQKQFDYYRPVTIKYLADSIVTDEKTIYNYRTIYRGTLSSLERNVFHFNRVIAKNIRVIIDNQDNTPLQITGMEIKGIPDKIYVRFTNTKIPYYVYYGNKELRKPRYELHALYNNIPKNSSEISLGEEELITFNKEKEATPFFNTLWLWFTLGIIILLLGSFSIRMIRNKQQES